MREDEKQMSAVIRTISILEALSKTDRINLENLAKETELPKATLLRFLSTLTSLGYVFRDGADMYHLTMKMFAVGSRSLKHIDLISTAIPFAKELSNDLGETVHMGILEDCNAVYVLKEESKYPFTVGDFLNENNKISAFPIYEKADKKDSSDGKKNDDHPEDPKEK